MKPRLYPADEISFASNGLGALSDAMSCIVTEERNGPYELEMHYPITGIHFDEIALSRIIWAKPADGKDPQPFRIYYISKPLNGEVEIKADHVSYQLSHIPVSPFSASTVAEAMAGLKNYSAETNPFTFWTDKSTSGNFDVTVPSSIRALLGGQEGSILDVYGGGEYEFDKYAVKLYQNRGADNGAVLRYGKNIIDIRQEENISSTYTGVYPYWLGAVESSDTEVLVELPEKVLHSPNAENFPYQRTIPLDLSSEFQEQPTEAQLRARAQAYMDANNIGIPSVSIEVDFVALWQTEEYKDMANLERVNLCDIVTVEFPLLGVSAYAKVVKTEYDALKERYQTIEVGDARTKLTTELTKTASEAISAQTRRLASKSFLAVALEKATDLLTGGLGGFVILNRNADGQPNEILIMDTDDITTAVNVIRMNQNGIGFSTNGYDGPFVSAWTIDGVFNADFINAGTLSANFIRGGTLTLGGRDNGMGTMVTMDANGDPILRINYQGLHIYDSYYDIYGHLGHNVFNYTSRYHSTDYNGGACTGLVVQDVENGTPTNMKGIGLRDASDFPVSYTRVKLTTDYSYSQEPAQLYEWDAIWRATSGNNVLYEHKRYVGKCLAHRIQSCNDDSVAYLQMGIYNSAPALRLWGWESGTTMNTIFDFYDGHVPAIDTSSSKRFKHDIDLMKDEEFDPHRLLNLQPKQFIYNDDHPCQYDDMKGKTLPGFIAEDVDEIYPSATIHDQHGNVKSWDERRIIPGMLALIQEQDEKIKKLEAEMLELRAMIMELREGK